jgi:ubiquinone/menaquinone biosynthesis C-methylase UbiE
MNKTIHRGSETSTKIFDNRTLKADYATLVPILKKGLRVLDVGCGTGAISKGIAEQVGKTGSVIAIDNTEAFINSGKETHKDVSNLELIHADLFEFQPKEKFDLVVAARVLQWLSNPKEALKKLASFLKPGGQISILDYNHNSLEWKPQPPESMRIFYKAFLKWRADAGMNNQIAEDLADYFAELGFHSIEVLQADEVYKRGDQNFLQKIRIWSKVAELKQIVEEGYISNDIRIRAIEEYNRWIESDAECMVMKLKEVRAKI